MLLLIIPESIIFCDGLDGLYIFLWCSKGPGSECKEFRSEVAKRNMFCLVEEPEHKKIKAQGHKSSWVGQCEQFQNSETRLL